MRLRVALLLTCLLPCLGYLPAHWTAAHARGDFTHADVVAVARVTTLERIDDGVDPRSPREHWFSVVATLRVGETLTGGLHAGETLRICIGASCLPEPPDDTQPAELALCNTQLGYDLRINEVYVLGLDLVKFGPDAHAPPPGPPLYDLRSGPCSAGWVTGGATGRVVRQGAIGREWGAPVSFEEYVACVRKGETAGAAPGK